MAYLPVDKAYIAQDLKSHCVEIVWDHEYEDGRLERRAVVGTLQASWLPEEFRPADKMQQLIYGVPEGFVPVLDVKQNRLFPLSLKRIVSAQIVNY